MTTQPLLQGLVVKTQDPEEAASYLRDAAVPYVSELLPGSPSFSTEIFGTRGHQVNVTRVMTTGLLWVQATLPADSYALVLDLGGDVGLHTIEHHSFPVGPEFALIQSPLQTADIRTAREYEVLFVRFFRNSMVEELQNLLGQESRKDLVFSPAVRMASQAGRKLRELCDNLRRAICSTNQQDVEGSMQIQKLESELMTLLLQSQPHNYRRLLNRGNEAGIWQLKAAEEFMRSNAHLPLSLGDVCQASGVNARTLQHSFRKRRGCSPMEFLRKVRMEEVRATLLSPLERTSVSGEAAHWGFLHFGRFSQEYRKRFGELPSETLRQSRRRILVSQKSK